MRGSRHPDDGVGREIQEPVDLTVLLGRPLRKLLADRIPDVRLIQRVCRDARISPGQVDWTGSPELVWGAIFDHLINSGLETARALFAILYSELAGFPVVEAAARQLGVAAAISNREKIPQHFPAEDPLLDHGLPISAHEVPSARSFTHGLSPTPVDTGPIDPSAPPPGPSPRATRGNPPATITWLHLSDFHFKARKDWRQNGMLTSLDRDVLTTLTNEGLSPDFVVVSGDIAHSGKKEQYDTALATFSAWAERLKLPLETHWCVVPGNHDVDWGRIPKTARFMPLADPEFVSELLDEGGMLASQFTSRQKPFLDFTESLHGEKGRWPVGAPWGVRVLTIRGWKVAVLCLNSAWVCGQEGERGKLLIGVRSVEHGLAEAETCGADLRLALVHHPLEYLQEHDEQRVRTRLEAPGGAHFLLRGHLHSAQLHATPGWDGLEVAAGACWKGSSFHQRVNLVQLDPLRGTGTVFVWGYSDLGQGTWQRVNDLYEGMHDGRWTFPLPEGQRFRIRAQSLLGGVDSDQPSQRALSPLIPQSYRVGLLSRLEQIEPAVSANVPILFRLKDIYVPLDTDWATIAEHSFAGKGVHRVGEGKAEVGDTFERPGLRSGSGAEIGGMVETSARAGDDKPIVASVGNSDLESETGGAVQAEKGLVGPLSELLSHPSQRHFLVVGDPGSGKSTFIRFSAYNGLRASVSAEDAQRLFLLLDLKDLSAWLAEHPGDGGEVLEAWAECQLKEDGLPEGHLKAHVGRGQVQWLLDGLDEIFETSLRLRAATIIGRYFGAGRGHADRLILTTRPHALAQRGIRTQLRLGVPAKVLPLVEAKQRLFTRRWFAHVYGEDDPIGQALLARLWSVLPVHEHLQPLRGNPLMLSAITSVFQGGKRLPERRADLYDAIVSTLLNVRFGPWVGGDESQVGTARRALEQAARWMMETAQARRIGVAELTRQVCSVLYEGRVPTVVERTQAESLAEVLGSRTGLLKADGAPPIYEFVHLGLQEFLAASAIARLTKPIEGVKRHLDDGGWHETILLTAGYLGMSGVAELAPTFIRELAGLRGESPGVCRRLLLAVQSAVEAPPGVVPESLKEVLRQHAVDALSDSEPSCPDGERLELSAALARLGDPRRR